MMRFMYEKIMPVLLLNQNMKRSLHHLFSDYFAFLFVLWARWRQFLCLDGRSELCTLQCCELSAQIWELLKIYLFFVFCGHLMKQLSDTRTYRSHIMWIYLKFLVADDFLLFCLFVWIFWMHGNDDKTLPMRGRVLSIVVNFSRFGMAAYTSLKIEKRGICLNPWF